MEFPFDILDYIFGFLRSEPESLIACSKAYPVFSEIVQRYLYYRVTIHTGKISNSGRGYNIEPAHLITLLSKTPRIVNHIRVLQIQGSFTPFKFLNLERIALILPRLPVLECITLTTCKSARWQMFPQSFRTAVTDCLQLPTLQELHLQVDGMYFPLSILNGNTNINCISLSSGSFEIPDCPDDTYPHLKSLFVGSIHRRLFIAWVKHLANLQSLTWDDYPDESMVLELVSDVCSETLNHLDLSLKTGSPYKTIYEPIEPINDPIIDLSSFPHLQRLTIRVELYSGDNCGFLEAVKVKVLKTASSLQHLTIECSIVGNWEPESDTLPNFSALTEAPPSIHHIDLYIFKAWMDVGYAAYDRLLSSALAEDGHLGKLIKQGMLVVHPDETAPKNSRFL